MKLSRLDPPICSFGSKRVTKTNVGLVDSLRVHGEEFQLVVLLDFFQRT